MGGRVRTKRISTGIHNLVLEPSTMCTYNSVVRVLVVYSLTGAHSKELNGVYVEYTCKD